jgi:hypothetical protein
LAEQPCKSPESHPHYGQYSEGAAGYAWMREVEVALARLTLDMCTRIMCKDEHNSLD